MAALSWAYVAGVFDGEGHISLALGVNSFKPAITIVQAGETGRELLLKLQSFLSGNAVRCGISTHSPDGHTKQEWHELYFSSRRSVDVFARNVLPYLVVKKVTMQDVARFLRIFGHRQGRGWR